MPWQLRPAWRLNGVTSRSAVNPGIVWSIHSRRCSWSGLLATRRTGHGGLGLAMTQLICVRRGGSVEVDGSVFTARVPHRTRSFA
jgi:hypothetical protein